MSLTGFLVNNVCQTSSSAAMTAIVARFPVIDNGLWVSANGITFSSPDNFILTLKTTNLNNTSASISNKTFTLVQCDPAVPLPPDVVFDPALAAAFWSTAMVFVLGCWLLAKNAGIIINAIRRL